jgi:hypothetical protein
MQSGGSCGYRTSWARPRYVSGEIDFDGDLFGGHAFRTPPEVAAVGLEGPARSGRGGETGGALRPLPPPEEARLHS